MMLEERLEHIVAMLTQLVERQAVKDFYTPEEFAVWSVRSLHMPRVLPPRSYPLLAEEIEW